MLWKYSNELWPNQYISELLNLAADILYKFGMIFLCFTPIQSHVFHPKFLIYQTPRQGSFGLHESRTPRVRYETSEVMKDSKVVQVKHSHTDNCFTNNGTKQVLLFIRLTVSRRAVWTNALRAVRVIEGEGGIYLHPPHAIMGLLHILFCILLSTGQSLFWELTFPHFQVASSGSFGNYL